MAENKRTKSGVNAERSPDARPWPRLRETVGQGVTVVGGAPHRAYTQEVLARWGGVAIEILVHDRHVHTVPGARRDLLVDGDGAAVPAVRLHLPVAGGEGDRLSFKPNGTTNPGPQFVPLPGGGGSEKIIKDN